MIQIDKDGSDQSRKQSYRIDHATKRRIVALHKKGLHVSHIAEELGITVRLSKIGNTYLFKLLL